MGDGMMRFRIFGAMVLSGVLFPVIPAAAQVTYGKRPNLPAPFATKSAGNGPEGTKPPAGFLPTAPEGFHVNVFAKDFTRPRFMMTAPNGDIFVADTGAGTIVVLRGLNDSGEAQQREVFAEKLNRPFGI